MKKIIIMSLFATLLSVFTASAQENTYSMVIKMQDGTVFTIGPNEADSIFFDEGTLTVSGKSIEVIMKRLDNQEADIMKAVAEAEMALKMTYDALNMANANKEDINSLKDIASSQKTTINDLRKNIAELQNRNDILSDRVDDQAEQINALANENWKMKARIEALEAAVNELMNQ